MTAFKKLLSSWRKTNAEINREQIRKQEAQEIKKIKQTRETENVDRKESVCYFILLKITHAFHLKALSTSLPLVNICYVILKTI